MIAVTEPVGVQPIHKIEPMIEKLGLLSFCNLGLPAYYRRLIAEQDEILRAAAISALMELAQLGLDQWPLAVRLSAYGAVNSRAFRFFMNLHEYDLAQQVAEILPIDATALTHERMRAELAGDFARLCELDQKLFLAQGNITHLKNARAAAENLGGWRAAIPLAVTAILAQPADPDGPFLLMTTLMEANQHQLLRQVCDLFRSSRVYPGEVAIFAAAILASEGHHKEALKLLQPVQVNSLGNKLAATAVRVRAEAYEGTGDFGQAYSAYVRLNSLDRRADLDSKQFLQGVLRRGDYKFDPMPVDERSVECLQMLGFPRSGTTLLENALAAHPEVETFEEIPALISARQITEREVASGGVVYASTGIKARKRYYDEIDRRRRKKSAVRLVDKMPIYSTEAKFLSQLFPQRRYLFSVRHPYDVVLSCFKQMFAPNSAMDNFRTIADACALYDFAMTQWFSVFGSSDSDHICYVRYDDLVLDFEKTMKKVVAFMGVGWDSAVLDFATLAQQRAVKTPSYSKVRSGLSAGVQSSWRNYRNYFGTKETALLDPWVKHFGYA